MIVKAILSAKGGDVISIDPTATLDTAVKTLAEHKIGALLVLGPDRRVIGILSERDIVRALAERGAGRTGRRRTLGTARAGDDAKGRHLQRVG
jgi:CBS domain-containing protein